MLVQFAAASAEGVAWHPWDRVDGEAAAHGGGGGHADGVHGGGGAAADQRVAANLVEVVVWLGMGSSGVEDWLGVVLALDGMDWVGQSPSAGLV